MAVIGCAPTATIPAATSTASASASARINRSRVGSWPSAAARFPFNVAISIGRQRHMISPATSAAPVQITATSP
jgi:hypothetical protein